MASTFMRLAHVELSGAADTIDTGTFTAKDNIIIVFSGVGTNASSCPTLRFNGTTGNEYAYRESVDGGDDVTETTQNHIDTTGDVGAFYYWFVADVANIDGKEKLVNIHGMDSNTAGASNVPRRREVAGKWITTSGQITSVQVLDLGSYNFASGSYITVWGASDEVANNKTQTNSIFSETDTGDDYIWNATSWVEIV